LFWSAGRHGETQKGIGSGRIACRPGQTVVFPLQRVDYAQGVLPDFNVVVQALDEHLLAFGFGGSEFLKRQSQVDERAGYHSFFYTHNPDALTQLGAALHFYGVASD